MKFSNNNTEKANKIFKRLCKEMGIFPGHFYKNMMEFFERTNSYIFYGRDDAHYSSYGKSAETKFYRLQLDFAKRLIEDKLLEPCDYDILLYDTLHRYNASRFNEWNTVAKESDKKAFVDFFIPKYQERICPLSENEISYIYKTLPTI